MIQLYKWHNIALLQHLLVTTVSLAAGRGKSFIKLISVAILGSLGSDACCGVRFELWISLGQSGYGAMSVWIVSVWIDQNWGDRALIVVVVWVWGHGLLTPAATKPCNIVMSPYFSFLPLHRLAWKPNHPEKRPCVAQLLYSKRLPLFNGLAGTRVW